jgi:hypothetical protein
MLFRHLSLGTNEDYEHPKTSRYPGRNSNWATRQYKSDALPLERTSLVQKYSVGILGIVDQSGGAVQDMKYLRSLER